MTLKRSLLFLFSFLGLSLIMAIGQTKDAQHDKHVEVSLRMIGHRLLLSSGDSTSSVLPIIEEEGRYRIQFESEFEFVPIDLVLIVNEVVAETKMATNSILEIEKCDTEEIVYSYEVNGLENSSIIPCQARGQDKSCYSLLFTLLDDPNIETELVPILTEIEAVDDKSNFYLYLAIGLLLIIAVFIFWYRNRKSKLNPNPNLITLGDYHFDKKNTDLILEGQRIELTAKEAELLMLLYNDVNSTIEREVILNRVWGDEGDYVGRTLDVFISKLRKKLESDSTVKIINVRGVGYKLVVG